MATSRTTSPKSVTVDFIRSAEKVNSVVYRAVSPTGQPISFYIPKDMLAAIGNPPKVAIAITAI